MQLPDCRYGHDALARDLAEIAGAVWLELHERDRDGYREIARYLSREAEEIAADVHEALAVIESEDDVELDGLIDILLDVLGALDRFALRRFSEVAA